MADVGRITELWRAAADALELTPDPQRMAKLDALVRAERAEAECGRLQEQLEQADDLVARLSIALMKISKMPGNKEGTGAAGWLLTLDAPDIARAALGVVGEPERDGE
jgi:hypothetical protein